MSGAQYSDCKSHPHSIPSVRCRHSSSHHYDTPSAQGRGRSNHPACGTHALPHNNSRLSLPTSLRRRCLPEPTCTACRRSGRKDGAQRCMQRSKAWLGYHLDVLLHNRTCSPDLKHTTPGYQNNTRSRRRDRHRTWVFMLLEAVSTSSSSHCLKFSSRPSFYGVATFHLQVA